MVTWQRRSSLCSRRVMSVTALGRSSLLLFPFNGPPLFLLPRWRSWVIWSEAIPNFAGTEFSEVRLPRYALPPSGGELGATNRDKVCLAPYPNKVGNINNKQLKV